MYSIVHLPSTSMNVGSGSGGGEYRRDLPAEVDSVAVENDTLVARGETMASTAAALEARLGTSGRESKRSAALQFLRPR